MSGQGGEPGMVVWFTGLPGAGKSTLARRVGEALARRRIGACILDSDEVRAALSPAPGFDEAGRDAFYRTLGQLAALLSRQGLVVLVAATAHRRRYRDQARRAAGAFLEVYVDSSPAECEARDPKGLYAAARASGSSTLPGVGTVYEPPQSPDVTARGGLEPGAPARVLAAVETGRARGGLASEGEVAGSLPLRPLRE